MKKPDKASWEGSASQELKLMLPCKFRMLCELAGVEPEQVLRDFMSTLGFESYGLGEEQRQAAREYFMRCGYGRDFYSPDDLRRIFHELEALRCLWPKNEEHKLDFDLYVSWRNMYYAYWFKKWYYRVRRRPPEADE